jgi:hypothetical protein
MKKTFQISQEWTGITPVMFDRYAGDNKTALRAEDKMYFAADGKSLILPAINIMSFLSAQNTTSVPKRFLDSREYKDVCQAMLSYITIEPFLIPLMAKGKQIEFAGWDEKIWIHKSVARLPKGIPNPKERPVINLPWELNLIMRVIENEDFNLKLLEDLIRKGGIALGIGTFRGLFGKFDVTKWEIKEI